MISFFVGPVSIGIGKMVDLLAHDSFFEFLFLSACTELNLNVNNKKMFLYKTWKTETVTETKNASKKSLLKQKLLMKLIP